MKMTIEMPQVNGCTVSECAYNLNDKCHARAITIGDGVHPGCDTAFLRSPAHTHDKKRIAGVGACKVVGCSFNNDLECTADSISVGLVNKQINCMTYSEG